MSDLTRSTVVRKHCHLRESRCFIIAARQMHLHKTPGNGPQTTDRTSLALVFKKKWGGKANLVFSDVN